MLYRRFRRKRRYRRRTSFAGNRLRPHTFEVFSGGKSGDTKPRGFLRHWTAKESVVKWLGGSLASDLKK
ncbi:MAG: 4'-phosphopantetheinyl transferase superfamily protein [Christensenellaceae bacterium]